MRSSAPSPRSRQPRPFPWGVAVCIAAAAVLLLGLAAAPFHVPARLRQRVENERRAALAALSGAMDILLKDGPFRRGMRTLVGLFAVLEVARLACEMIF